MRRGMTETVRDDQNEIPNVVVEPMPYERRDGSMLLAAGKVIMSWKTFLVK